MSNQRQQLYAGRVLDLFIEEHTLPDGRSGRFEMVRHPGGAAVLPVLDDGRLLLICQFRPSVGAAVIEIPAGRLDPGDSPEGCARRELEEEVGLRAGRLESLGYVYSAIGFCDERIALFVARDLESCPARPEPDEFIEPLPVAPDLARRMLERNEIPDSKTQIALLRYLQGTR